ncbi:MAG: hypothetical protein ABIO70_35210 [Pseudomonadota bacterium]
MILPLLALALQGGLSAAWAQAPAAGCPDVNLSLGALRQQLDEARFDEASALGRKLEEQLTCQPRAVNPVTLASLYQLLGAVQYFSNERDSADYYWSVALAMGPSTSLDPSLGQGAVDAFERVRAKLLAEPTAAAQIAPGVSAWLDGRRLVEGMPQDVLAGLHLLQREEAGGALTAQMVQLAPGTRYQVEAGDALIGMIGTTSSGATPAAPLAAVKVQRVAADLPWKRIALNGATSAAGIGLGIAAVYNYAQASEAYHDYLWIQDETRANTLYNEEFRGRGTAFVVEGIGAVALLGGSAALWATTDGLEREGGPPVRRLLLDGTVVMAGLGLGAASIYNLRQTGAAYDDYMVEEDSGLSGDIYTLEIRPRRGLAVAEGIGAVALLGVGTTLFLTTDLAVTLSPTGFGASARW